MPNRILRDGINSSARINRLSMGAEVLYRRLMSVADDYGRYYANPVTVRGACWPTHTSPPREQDVSRWISECAQGDRPLISLYSVDGCQYLYIIDFNQQTRSKSKFPEPASGLISSCEQLADKVPALDVDAIRSSETDAETETETETETPAQGALALVPPISESDLVSATAARLRDRHPLQRSCSQKEAEQQLRSIIASVPKNERAARLQGIDLRHQGWCESEDWTKEGGKYAKGLANWLAPTKGRFDLLPPPRAPTSATGSKNQDAVLDLAKRNFERTGSIFG